MVVTYYADVIFAWNFVMDFILLVLIHPDTKKQYWRLSAAATIGATVALLMLYLPVQVHILYLGMRFFCAVVMVVVAVPAKCVGEVLCNAALLYGASGGVFGISILISEGQGEWKAGVAPLMAVSVGIMFIGKVLYHFRRKQNQQLAYQYRVSIINGQNQTESKAFLDSGNHLYEPISGKIVILIRDRVAKKLNLDSEKIRVVPYSSLGKKAGILEAYPIEELVVYNGKNENRFKYIYVAKAENCMFEQENCDVILHAELSGGNTSLKYANAKNNMLW